MPTWDKVYAAEDRTARRAATDIALRARHAQFDLQAQDKTPKSARHHWAVVGEGSRSANENYAKNYARIFPVSSRRTPLPSGLASSARPGVGTA